MTSVEGGPERDLLGGRYRLGPVIGTGSSAVVRRGRDRRDGVRVAIKLFHPGGTPNDRHQHRREMDALSRLDHPGLTPCAGAASRTAGRSSSPSWWRGRRWPIGSGSRR